MHHYTGLTNDDRRIGEELQAMGAFDGRPESHSAVSGFLTSAGEFLTWLRWKSEVGVVGYRVGATYARALESKTRA